MIVARVGFRQRCRLVGKDVFVVVNDERFHAVEIHRSKLHRRLLLHNNMQSTC